MAEDRQLNQFSTLPVATSNSFLYIEDQGLPYKIAATSFSGSSASTGQFITTGQTGKTNAPLSPPCFPVNLPVSRKER